jgi:hypothetical protein
MQLPVLLLPFSEMAARSLGSDFHLISIHLISLSFSPFPSSPSRGHSQRGLADLLSSAQIFTIYSPRSLGRPRPTEHNTCFLYFVPAGSSPGVRMPTTHFDMFWTLPFERDGDYLLEERNTSQEPSQCRGDRSQSEEFDGSDSALNSPTTSTPIQGDFPEMAVSYLDVSPSRSPLPRSLTTPSPSHRYSFAFRNSHTTYCEGDLFPKLDEVSYKPDVQKDLQVETENSNELDDGPFSRTRYSRLSAWPIPPPQELLLPPAPWATNAQLDIGAEYARSSFYTTDSSCALPCPVDVSVHASIHSNNKNKHGTMPRDFEPTPRIVSSNQESGVGQSQTTWLSLPPKEPKTQRATSASYFHTSRAYPGISVQPSTPSSGTFPQTIINQPDLTGRINSSAAVIEYANSPSPFSMRPPLSSYPLLSYFASTRQARSPSIPVGIGASFSSSNPHLLRESPYYYGSVCHPSLKRRSSIPNIHELGNNDEITFVSHILDTPTHQPRRSALLTRRSKYHNCGASQDCLSQSLRTEFQDITNASIAVRSLNSRWSHPVAPTSQAEPTSFVIVNENIEDTTNKCIRGLPLLGSMACLWLGNFLVTLLTAMTPVATPKISTHFHGLQDIGLYASSYFLLLATSLPTFHIIYQLFSSKMIYLASLLIFQGMFKFQSMDSLQSLKFTLMTHGYWKLVIYILPSS